MQFPTVAPLSARQESEVLATVEGALAYTAVTFSIETDNYDAETGIASDEATATVVGKATEVDGHPERYEALNLTRERSKTLLFLPDTAAEEPELGSTCTWGGVGYTVKGVFPIGLRGAPTASISEVVVSR